MEPLSKGAHEDEVGLVEAVAVLRDFSSP
jgi:hypothetical protein